MGEKPDKVSDRLQFVPLDLNPVDSRREGRRGSAWIEQLWLCTKPHTVLDSAQPISMCTICAPFVSAVWCVCARARDYGRALRFGGALFRAQGCQ